MVSNYKSLAIVGNGFDLQLGIKSRFIDFANSVHFPELDDFKKFCDDLVTDDDTVDTTRIEYWSSFEERINQITYVRSPVADMSFDCEKARKELEIINRDYCIIKHELIAYLRMASKKNRYIIDSVKDVINNQTMIINFNYTDTFEEYSNNIFYVHGSINENNIVLGYDDRGERCMSQALDVRWRKNICRERLEYTRYLKRVLGLVPNDEEYKKYIEALAIYLNYRDTPRGIDSENQKEIPMFKDIKKFYAYYKKQGLIPNCDLKSIEKIIVIGHGLVADKTYLKQIFDACKSLKGVDIFSYEGESATSIENKKEFFAPFCDNINILSY